MKFLQYPLAGFSASAIPGKRGLPHEESFRQAMFVSLQMPQTGRLPVSGSRPFRLLRAASLKLPLTQNQFCGYAIFAKSLTRRDRVFLKTMISKTLLFFRVAFS